VISLFAASRPDRSIHVRPLEKPWRRGGRHAVDGGAAAMSPLQYQKQIRIQQARLRLLANPADVAGTGHAVGYTSAPQFSREYRRLFGAPPGRDAAQLQNASRTPD
jgi:hypothetical protein